MGTYSFLLFYFFKSEVQKCRSCMGNIQPDVSPCPTFTVVQKSFANLTFQTAPSRRKLLVRCPRNCHLIIACHFACQPRTYLTQVHPKANNLLSSLHFFRLPPLETLAVKMQLCAPNSGPRLVFETLAVAFVELSIYLPPTPFIPHLSIYLLLSVACFYS